jgi:hypothetical protein
MLGFDCAPALQDGPGNPNVGHVQSRYTSSGVQKSVDVIICMSVTSLTALGSDQESLAQPSGATSLRNASVIRRTGLRRVISSFNRPDIRGVLPE